MSCYETCYKHNPWVLNLKLAIFAHVNVWNYIEAVLLTTLNLIHGHLPQSGRLPGILWYFLPRVVYEGQVLECVLDGCTTEEDVVHMFRVTAMNEVGRGPYSMPVTFTQRKACEFKVHAWTGNVC